MKKSEKGKKGICGNQQRARSGGKPAAALAIFAAAVMLSGCGGMDEITSISPGGYTTGAVSNDSYYDYDYGFDMAPEYEISAEEQKEANTGNQPSDALSQRKLIRTVHMEVETKEYDQLLATLERKVQGIGGYIENMESYNGSSYSSYRGSRYANLTLRIPKNELDGFLELVSDVGNVVRRTESVEDVTLSYVDLESHRNALRTEQERLLELLERAETLEDILIIEDRLSNVRYQLESMESRLRTMDNQVDYSTLYLQVSEVQELTPVEEPTVWSRIAEGFGNSLENIGDGALEIMIWFVVNIPYLVLVAVIFGLFLFFVKAHWKKSMKKATDKRAEEMKAAQMRAAEMKAVEMREEGSQNVQGNPAGGTGEQSAQETPESAERR